MKWDDPTRDVDERVSLPLNPVEALRALLSVKHGPDEADSGNVGPADDHSGHDKKSS